MDKTEMRDRLRQVIEQYAKSPSWTPRQEVREPLFWKSIRAEFIGSLLLVVFTATLDSVLGPVMYGSMVAVLTYTLRATGVHMNPVVSLAALLLRSITSFRCIALVLAQAIGTLSGATVISLGLSSNETLSLVSPILAVSQAKGFGYEFFATFVIILAMASHLETPQDELMFPVISGIAVGSASIFARSSTGGFLNPFRAFSLALFQSTPWSTHYIYWVGPVLGTLLAVFTYDFIRPSRLSTMTHKRAARMGNVSIVAKHEDEITQGDTEFTLATLS